MPKGRPCGWSQYRAAFDQWRISPRAPRSRSAAIADGRRRPRASREWTDFDRFSSAARDRKKGEKATRNYRLKLGESKVALPRPPRRRARAIPGVAPHDGEAGYVLVRKPPRDEDPDMRLADPKTTSPASRAPTGTPHPDPDGPGNARSLLADRASISRCMRRGQGRSRFFPGIRLRKAPPAAGLRDTRKAAEFRAGREAAATTSMSTR